MARVDGPVDRQRRGPLRLCAVVAAVGLAFPGCDGSSPPDTTGRADVVVSPDWVATVGIRALIRAGLQDRDAFFLAYDRVEKTDDGWRVMLSGGTSYLEMKRDGDELVVVGAAGLGTGGRFRRKLVGYRQSAASESHGFEFYDVEIGSGPVVEASFFFRGPIPTSYRAECRVEVLGEGQDPIYRGPVFEPETPRYESARAGGFYSKPVPARAGGGRPRISCEASR